MQTQSYPTLPAGATLAPPVAPASLSPWGQAALKAAAGGWHVFPIRPRCKAPPLVAFTRHATRDPAVISHLWQAWPRANIGVLCGRMSQLLVIDVDTARGDRPSGCIAFQRLLRDIPDIARAIVAITATPSGGRHFHVKVPSGFRLRPGVARDYPGIDFKFDGGYVLIGPSTLGTKQYATAYRGRISDA